MRIGLLTGQRRAIHQDHGMTGVNLFIRSHVFTVFVLDIGGGHGSPLDMESMKQFDRHAVQGAGQNEDETSC